jgi:hypothetical protein
LTVDRLLDTPEGIESNPLKHYRYKSNRSRKTTFMHLKKCRMWVVSKCWVERRQQLSSPHDTRYRYYIHMFVKRAVFFSMDI